MLAIANHTMHFDFGHGPTAEHALSSGPDGGFRDAAVARPTPRLGGKEQIDVTVLPKTELDPS